MTTLVLDTARTTGGVALAGADGVIAEATWDDARTQSQHLWPSVHRLLGEQTQTLDDIDRVVAVRGPGRLTGLRLGLVVAQTLCDGTDRRLCGVTLFEQVAAECGETVAEALCVVAEGITRHRVWQWHRREGERWVAEGEAALVPQAEFTAQLVARAGVSATLFAGPAVGDLALEISAVLGERAEVRPVTPSLEGLWRASRAAPDADGPVAPIYLT